MRSPATTSLLNVDSRCSVVACLIHFHSRQKTNKQTNDNNNNNKKCHSQQSQEDSSIGYFPVDSSSLPPLLFHHKLMWSMDCESDNSLWIVDLLFDLTSHSQLSWCQIPNIFGCWFYQLWCIRLYVYIMLIISTQDNYLTELYYPGNRTRTSFSGTFLQTRPELVTPLKGRHSLFPRSCPQTRPALSERFGY